MNPDLILPRQFNEFAAATSTSFRRCLPNPRRSNSASTIPRVQPAASLVRANFVSSIALNGAFIFFDHHCDFGTTSSSAIARPSPSPIRNRFRRCDSSDSLDWRWERRSRPARTVAHRLTFQIQSSMSYKTNLTDRCSDVRKCVGVRHVACPRNTNLAR